MNKKVSVVVATYNGERFIEEQLDSILHQTYPPFEVIVKDDGSTDHTVSIVKDYAHKWPNVRLVQNEQNLGITKNFISGFFLAQGDYIAYSDQDDIWHPQKLELLLEAIGDGNMAYSNSAICDSEGKVIAPLIQKQQLVSEVTSILDLTVWGHQLLFKRDLLQINDPYYFTQYIWLDAYLPMVAFQGKNTNVSYVPTPLVYWRRHDTTSSIAAPPRLRKHVFSMLGYRLKDLIEILKAIFSVFDSAKKENVKHFYQRIGEIKGMSEDTYEVASLLARCGFFDVCKAGQICVKNYLKDHSVVSLELRMRLFLKPFFSIRNQSKGMLDS